MHLAYANAPADTAPAQAKQVARPTRLQARDVTLAYDERIVVDGVTLEAPAGQVRSPSSSGQTPAASRRCCAGSRGC